MKKGLLLFFFQSILLSLFFCGCEFFNCNSSTPLVEPQIVQPVNEKKCNSEFPVAQNKSESVKVAEKVLKPESPQCVSQPVVQEKIICKKEEKKAVENKNIQNFQPPVHPVIPRRSANHENYRRGPGFWRAFNRLSPEEKQQLLSIQRSDPEKYRKILHEKADKLYEMEKVRKEEFDSLIAKIKKAESEKEKESLKNVLRNKLKEDFQQRLQDTRRDIEAYKRRTAKLESELQKREKNCDAIIEAIMNKRLSNNL